MLRIKNTLGTGNMPVQNLLVRYAPLVFVVLWSTGFIAARFSMNNADPFVFLSLRFSITVIILLPIVLLADKSLPWGLWSNRHDMVTGLLLHCGYLGCLFWPIKNGVPSGIVAIIVGLQPIVTAALASLFIGEQLDRRKLAGLLIGFFGIGIVVIGKYGIGLGSSGGLAVLDLLLCIASLLSIAIGVFYQKKFCNQSQLLRGILTQYVTGTAAAAGFALLCGEAWRIDWSVSFATALVWQVLGLSIGAFMLMMYLIRHGEAGRVSSLFYLVPPLVVVEAHFLFGEILGPVSIAGMLMCWLGFHLVNRRLCTTLRSKQA